jgi:hypothetical protein
MGGLTGSPPPPRRERRRRAYDPHPDYVGMTEAAKHYGRLRMFLLHHTAGE